MCVCVCMCASVPAFVLACTCILVYLSIYINIYNIYIFLSFFLFFSFFFNYIDIIICSVCVRACRYGACAQCTSQFVCSPLSRLFHRVLALLASSAAYGTGSRVADIVVRVCARTDRGWK